MTEDLAVSHAPQMGIEFGSGALGPRRLRSFCDALVVVGEIDIVIDRDGMGHEGVMRLVAPDQVGPDKPWRRMEHEEQNEHHGRFVSVHLLHSCILSQEELSINIVIRSFDRQSSLDGWSKEASVDR
jgi:hypothetical protein